jgi:archaea-specific DNA-binding protein
MMAEEKGNADNIIFIGGKSLMSYVTGVVVQFNNKEAEEVTVKSRGKFISKAVDVVEVAKNKFLKDKNIQVKDIKIGSEEFENKEGRMVNVSVLEVVLKKA